MNVLIAIVVGTGSALILGLFLLLRRLACRGSELPVTAEWIDELSAERYRPMLRLLDGSDIAYLRSQPGFTPRMARQLRQQRCQTFRGYLRCLQQDFDRVCAAIRLVMLHSNHDRPDLAAALLRHRTAFVAGVIVLQCRLVLYRLGLGAADAAGLVEIFDRMRVELRTLIPSPAALEI